MKVVYTAAALQDFDEIADWVALHYPNVARDVEDQIRATVLRISHWPESARRSSKRTSVRVAPVVRYPYKIFYRITDHAARRPWDEQT